MMKRIKTIIFCILLLLTTALPAFAAETGSITVLFKHERQPVAEASFRIYKAAEWNGSGYTLVSPLSGYSVRLADDPASEEWRALAFTMSAYAARDNITPIASGQTDESGSLTFEGLSDGLYLVTGSPTEFGDLLIFPQPMLVSVPFENTDGTHDYHVVTEPKYEVRHHEDTTVTRRALKIWNDDGNESKRPQDIIVQLLCDGAVYDEQTLNKDNQWSYTWKNLDAAKDWQLTEKEVPDDYTVEITRQDLTFIVTNTIDNPPPDESTEPVESTEPDEPTGSEESTGSTESTETAESTEPVVPVEPTEPTEPILPQTGLLWWPVPVLGGIGAVTLFFGIFLLLRDKDGSDA